MTDTNLMKFFVSREDGTSSLLATALDPQLDDDRQQDFRERFCQYIKSQSPEVDLLPAGPSIVRTEYRGMDLAMVWGDWILVVENKVAAAVNEKQLARYYRFVRTALRKRKSTLFGLDHKELANKRICIIFVIPTEKLGRLGLAFNAVELKSNRMDEKLHLWWQTILDDLTRSFPDSKASDAFGRIIRDAIERTTTILLENQKKTAKTDFTEERNATKKFLEEVRKRVRSKLPSKGKPKLEAWQGERHDNLYCRIGGNGGSVALRIQAGQTTLVQHDNAILNGWIEFKMAGKAIKKRGEEFNAIPVESWADSLKVRADSLEIKEKCCVTQKPDTEWSKSYTELVEQVATLFHSFLITFRQFMAPHQAEEQQSSD